MWYDIYIVGVKIALSLGGGLVGSWAVREIFYWLVAAIKESNRKVEEAQRQWDLAKRPPAPQGSGGRPPGQMIQTAFHGQGIYVGPALDDPRMASVMLIPKSEHGAAHHRLECECEVCYPKPPQRPVPPDIQLVREDQDPPKRVMRAVKVKCKACQQDWGHGYCGVCKGEGTVVVEQPIDEVGGHPRLP